MGLATALALGIACALIDGVGRAVTSRPRSAAASAIGANPTTTAMARLRTHGTAAPAAAAWVACRAITSATHRASVLARAAATLGLGIATQCIARWGRSTHTTLPLGILSVLLTYE
jgi:hypothetical protein